MIIKLDVTNGGNVLYLEGEEKLPPMCDQCARTLGLPFYYSLSTKKFSCTDCVFNEKKSRISIVRILSTTAEDKQDLIEYIKIIKLLEPKKHD